MESCSKKLHPNRQTNILLHKALHQKTLDIVHQSQLPYLVFDEQNQQGANFAEKFCNALSYTFGRGFTSVIAIGSDCANLTLAHLQQTSAQVQLSQNVIGADTNGGFYLLGIQNKSYSRAAFLQFNWGTKKLFTQVVKHLKNTYSKATIFLQQQIDVNSIADVKALLNFPFKSLFVRFLQLLLIQLQQYFTFSVTIVSALILPHLPSRAPPYCTT